MNCSNRFVSRLRELIRGREQEFLSELQPLIAQQNVTLDLEGTERIDAAGLAALITLYCEARKSGHRFTVANPSPHVEEVLRLVGLDAILMSRNAEDVSYFRTELEQTAA